MHLFRGCLIVLGVSETTVLVVAVVVTPSPPPRRKGHGGAFRR